MSARVIPIRAIPHGPRLGLNFGPWASTEGRATATLEVHHHGEKSVDRDRLELIDYLRDVVDLLSGTAGEALWEGRS